MDLVEFLTSKEIIVVYIIAFSACLLCFIIYLVEKNSIKARQRHNTRELNKLVSEVREKANIKDEVVENSEPVLQVITPVIQVEEVKEKKVVEEKVEDEIESLEEEELEYTSIEPDQETAKKELKKLEEEIKKQEEIIENNSSILDKYEQAQEESAIISLDELISKGKDMYEANELITDEGDEPISLEELEKHVGREVSEINENFVIEDVVPKEETTPVVKQVSMDDFNTIKVDEVKKTEEPKRFKSSPVISPIFGIEKEPTTTDMELENTADYDKLDAEIKKTNEFLMTLKELQSKLD